MDNPFYCPFMGELSEEVMKERQQTCKKEHCYFYDRNLQRCFIPLIGKASLEFIDDLRTRREAREVSTLKSSADVYSYDDKQDQINVLLSIAEKHYKSSNLAAAITEYKKIIILDAENVKAHFELGCIYKNTGRHNEAIGEFKDVLAINPDYGLACLYLMEEYKKLYADYSEKEVMYDGIIKKFKTVVETNPYDSNAYFAYAAALNTLHSEDSQRDISRREAAVEAFSKAIELNPQNIYSYWGLKDVYTREFKDGRVEYEKIIEVSKRAVALNDRNANAYFELAMAYYKKPEGDMQDDAVVNFEKALEFEKNNWEIFFALGEIFQKRYDYARAIEKFTQALALAPKNHEIYYRLASIYYLSDFYDKAIAI
jgi:tetratricopeptide (TPR) repeat protein